ncbi:lipopolysaccharide biosynthesis protein [Microbacterium sp. A204]|uniref:lipopolysaccharide biosynthesis protein n=1 Tax=Microbacterium sp. A204 TaxID=3457321 RepID=UPI003FCF2231
MSMGSVDSAGHRSRRSIFLVLFATVVSGASGFVTLLIVAPVVGPVGYASFSLYWSALFMVVGVLFGVQQETTRAVSGLGQDPTEKNSGASVIRFAGVLAAAVLLLTVLTSIFWAEPLFGSGNADWGIALAVGIASYVGVATLNGVLAGSGQWGGFAAIPIIDGVLRLVLVVIALWAGGDGAALAWAVALPFPVSVAAVAVARWSIVRSRSTVRESYRTFSLNASRTIVASTANAVLVTGFPVILSLVGSDDRAALGVVVLALTLARAPILVPLTVLQSMLIARFSASPATARRLMVTVLLGLAAVTPILAAVAGLWGEGVLVRLFGEDFAVSGALLAWLVVASGCLGLLTVTGARVLAAGRHNVFATGWVLACLLAIAAVVLTPGELGVRTVVGLVAGPLIGVVVHLAFRRRR